MSQKPLPLQPTYVDENGTERFQGNKYVRFLLESGPFDLNHLASLEYPPEDYEQLMQLIGYSVGGFLGLSTTSEATRSRLSGEASLRFEPGDILDITRASASSPYAETYLYVGENTGRLAVLTVSFVLRAGGLRYIGWPDIQVIDRRTLPSVTKNAEKALATRRARGLEVPEHLRDRAFASAEEFTEWISSMQRRIWREQSP